MRYALDLADLTLRGPTEHDHGALCLVLAAVTSSLQLVDCVPQDASGGVGVVLECPDEQAEAIVRCVAMRCSASRQHVMRVYQQESGHTTWHRLSRQQLARLAKVETASDN